MQTRPTMTHAVRATTLQEDSAAEAALIFGELYLYNGEWKFRAVGQGNTSGLVGVLADFGLAGA